ncbi:hypothetical protein BGZ61DRAFT_180975 [Ilyonectria robusta]|uniref:uncharacterized protein n=1 Tax=Ilyonectria robusta TaxID=1079257 RepID=UPI001E8D67D3|nr:uncharacterized protein BGZ61DRAFT_180975 [Ilyonectria robusta]KAH8729383.1 hypothetical protein BGZ61DRAFT_180975 [Ilyonectria robusta]
MSQHELLLGRALREERTGDNNEKKKVEAASCHGVGGSERRIVTLQGFGGGGLEGGGFLGAFWAGRVSGRDNSFVPGRIAAIHTASDGDGWKANSGADPNLEAPPEHPWCHRRGRVTAFLSSTSASDQISLVQPQHAKWPVVRPSYRPPSLRHCAHACIDPTHFVSGGMARFEAVMRNRGSMIAGRRDVRSSSSPRC